MKPAIAFFLSLMSALAQPMPPMDFGPFEPVEPTTYRAMAEWKPYTNAANGLLLSCSNAATNLVVSMPIGRTNQSIVVVEGTNRVTLSATNASGSGATSIVWYAYFDRYQRLFAESSPGMNGPWTLVPFETMTNTVGISFLRTGITNWTKLVGRTL